MLSLLPPQLRRHLDARLGRHAVLPRHSGPPQRRRRGAVRLSRRRRKPGTENFGYSNTEGDWQKCHCCRLSLYLIIFSIKRSFLILYQKNCNRCHYPKFSVITFLLHTLINQKCHFRLSSESDWPESIRISSSGSRSRFGSTLLPT